MMQRGIWESLVDLCKYLRKYIYYYVPGKKNLFPCDVSMVYLFAVQVPTQSLY